MNFVFAFAPNIITPLQSKILVGIGIVLMVLGIALFIIGILKTPTTAKDSDISKCVTDILVKMHKRTLALEKKTLIQYLDLFNASDFHNLWNNPAFKTLLMPAHQGIIDNERKRTKGKKLRQDSIKRREQVDGVFEHLKPITDMEWTLEKVVALGNLLDKLPNEQNVKYKGIIQRREKDRHWNRLFKQLNKIKVTYANIFADRNLEKLINDYIDWSFAGSTLLFVADISNKSIPVDTQPSAFINSGASNPSVTIENRMTRLLEDIANKINELYKNNIEERSTKRETEKSLILTLQSWAIGLSGMTDYPNKPDGASWLRLKVAVNSTYNEPIDTLDLLIGNAPPIPVNDWPRRKVAAFTAYFNVTDWIRKGEIQVELKAHIEDATYTTGRIKVDFNVAPGGFDRAL
jgi:hypothetical protein